MQLQNTKATIVILITLDLVNLSTRKSLPMQCKSDDREIKINLVLIKLRRNNEC